MAVKNRLPPMPSRSASLKSSQGGDVTPKQLSRPASQYSFGSNMSQAVTQVSNKDYERSSETPGMGADEIDMAVERHLLKNPFLMPPDEEVFKMREEEKRRKREERELMKTLKVHEKGTFSSRMSTTKPPDMVAGDDAKIKQEGQRELAAAAAVPTDHRRREKENMADFIAKKREIFLVQMSLDTKRAEIRKLEERALQREEALRKSEQMLEEDALRFDAFLKENDEKVQEAIKRAEVEAKAKQDKVHEIKRLNAAIATIRSELNKYEEQLEDCRKYKEFLDNLTPPEYFKEQEDARQRRKAEKQAKKEADRQMRVDAVDAARAAALIAAEKACEGQPEQIVEQTMAAAATAPEVQAAEGALRAYDQEQAAQPEEEEDTDPPMYFQRPQQLLDIFAQLEEQNLFLIQNCQETEEALEELKSKYRETKARMDAETDSLKTQIEALQNSIKTEEEKGKALRERSNENTQGALAGKQTTLEELAAKVADVYVRCGFDNDASVGTLQMLTNIEAKLEEYLSIIDQMPEDFVEQAEKAREKERRQRAREEKLEQQRREQERRVQRSLERAQAPVHKKQGKPVMYRSQPPQRKKKDQDNGPKKSDEEEELQAFLQREF
mmetsp:Transcript_586/g.698  ORF Transcript_586/g.698 Transcript_586/m.698 type:complete len:612 (+) Transcript_586:184-2019(+)|eukprot:CAMPEP_0197851310 /NCGR_PEP_ID=MMETSP1438-20131217/17781_1 /TAXON_ID=1461541 /ORGANISM="Pterosperma sp., Strain CCMP1384" /LENGTH=611 /DNA_ID=CAMNT_0043464879 /DNA_START=184 /DNA_END=2019 /DNA_ORIENTATION=+